MEAHTKTYLINNQVVSNLRDCYDAQIKPDILFRPNPSKTTETAGKLRWLFGTRLHSSGAFLTVCNGVESAVADVNCIIAMPSPVAKTFARITRANGGLQYMDTTIFPIDVPAPVMDIPLQRQVEQPIQTELPL